VAALVAVPAFALLLVAILWGVAGPVEMLDGSTDPPRSVYMVEPAAMIAAAVLAAVLCGGAVVVGVALWRRDEESLPPPSAQPSPPLQQPAEIGPRERLRLVDALLRSDDAATRAGAARDLVALADSWPDGRQGCVDLLCAYLRDHDPDDGVARDLQRSLVDRLPRRQVTQGEEDAAVTPTSGDGSWADMTIDLRGAKLADWDCRFAVIPARMDFSRVTFAGDTSFHECRFAGSASFAGAVFEGRACFQDIEVARDARFKDAQFRAQSEFDGARFSGRAVFSWAKFEERAHFTLATFGRTADFQDAEFLGATSFDGATFSSWTSLTSAGFHDKATFYETSFDRVTFNRVTFGPAATFQDAKLRCPQETRFIGVTGLAPREVVWLTSQDVKVVLDEPAG
jgi:uncharacterized protein YjbI with pentapeptide repeats